MTQDQAILFALFGAVFAGLLWGRWRYDLVAFAALLAGVVLGVVPQDAAFSGFGHPAVLVVALVLIVSGGLTRSGAVHLITHTLMDKARGTQAHIALMGGVGAALSGFMNNVAALALLMPVDIAVARKAGRAAGVTLMPLAFATILGGMVTLIGTPPNIIIATIREDELGASFAMFDFAPVGLAVAVAGMAFVALAGWRLIPVREDAGAGEHEYKRYLAELTVPEDNDCVGRRVRDLYEAAEEEDVAIIGLIREGKRRYGTSANTEIRAGDALVLEATPEALEEFRTTLSLSFADKEREERLKAEGEGLTLVEAVVPEGARIAGRSVQAVGLSWRQQTLLLGVSREGRQITERMRQTKLRPGDILLLLAPKERANEVVEWLGVLPLADRGLTVTENSKIWTAIGIFAAAVIAASVGLLYLPVALGIVAVAYVLIGVLPLSEVYEQVEWPVIVLLGSLIPLGSALEDVGGTSLIADGLLTLTTGWPVWAVLAVLLVVTMTLSDILNNTATAVVAAPVAIDMGQRLGVSPDAFLMAVAVGASCAFLTPIGHKNNTLILGPGGYRFGDYWRMGLPLEAIVVAVAVPVIWLVWI
ncbi:SLC13 family permease [Rhodosalinus halophilus]|uniref:SLC13 family permease n=1 Tax=Rhodosalinus halophilus TaxID=2259333 RepID=A0A365UC31_9RHOB|nr:SLC13 family permease [Rhodosalinus halophilus]RBI86822.1 SLC13 family permease [Rhodosalinus halophilus]